MRFISPVCTGNQWWLTIFYIETGRAQALRVGKAKMFYGGNPEFIGRPRIIQFEVTNEQGSVELFAGAYVMGVVCSPNPGIDEQYKASLSPADAVQLVNPREIVEVDGNALVDLSPNADFLRKQLDTNRKRVFQ